MATTKSSSGTDTAPVKHRVITSITPNGDPSVQGGTWQADCTVCKWTKSGEYTRDRYEYAAREVAEELGENHEKEPEKA